VLCLTESPDDEWGAELHACLPRPPAQTEGTSEEDQREDHGGGYGWEIVPEVVIIGVRLEDSHGLMFVVVFVVVVVICVCYDLARGSTLSLISFHWGD
jgi:hypothetical protein